MELVTVWRTWQLAQGLSLRTITERTRIIAALAAACETRPDLITVDQIANWLAAHDWWRPSTRATYHASLRAWFSWLVQQGHRIDDPMAMLAKPRRPRGVPHPVTDDQLRRLLGIRMHRRTRVMILLACLAGLRVHEIAKIRGDDLDLDAHTIRVLGKGGVLAEIPLHGELVAIAATMPRTGWWFPSHTRAGRPVTGHSVTDIVGEAMRRAGIRSSAHSLRHWFGTSLVDGGADLRVAQTLLRHASLATTQIYTAVRDQRRVDAIGRLDLGLLDAA
jgi:integrase/recombinase XerD